jgi:hypothetical protein
MHELTSSVQKHNDGGDGKAESAGEPEVFECSEACRGCQRQDEVTVRGYPEIFPHRCLEITQPPCGNETQGDRRGRVGSA